MRRCHHRPIHVSLNFRIPFLRRLIAGSFQQFGQLLPLRESVAYGLSKRVLELFAVFSRAKNAYRQGRYPGVAAIGRGAMRCKSSGITVV